MFTTTHHKFQKLEVKQTVKVPCLKCGKKAPRVAKAWQTMNPFNKNKDGSIKSSQEIYRELNQEVKICASAILDAKRICSKCA